MLGRLGMSVDEAIDAYRKLAAKVFSETKSRFQEGKFKASNLESVVREIVQQRTGNSEEKMIVSDATVSKWYVPSS